MSAKKTTGKRASYGAEIDGLLKDYCAAVHNVPERNVVRDAIRHFIAFQLSENSGIRATFEANRRARLAGERPELRAISDEENE